MHEYIFLFNAPVNCIRRYALPMTYTRSRCHLNIKDILERDMLECKQNKQRIIVKGCV